MQIKLELNNKEKADLKRLFTARETKDLKRVLSATLYNELRDAVQAKGQASLGSFDYDFKLLAEVYEQRL